MLHQVTYRRWSLVKPASGTCCLGTGSVEDRVARRVVATRRCHLSAICACCWLQILLRTSSNKEHQSKMLYESSRWWWCSRFCCWWWWRPSLLSSLQFPNKVCIWHSSESKTPKDPGTTYFRSEFRRTDLQCEVVSSCIYAWVLRKPASCCWVEPRHQEKDDAQVKAQERKPRSMSFDWSVWILFSFCSWPWSGKILWRKNFMAFTCFHHMVSCGVVAYGAAASPSSGQHAPWKYVVSLRSRTWKMTWHYSCFAS